MLFAIEPITCCQRAIACSFHLAGCFRAADGSAHPTNCADSTDPNQRNVTTVTGYDALGRVVKTTNPLGVTRTEYDALGRMVAATDAEGRTASFGYDATGP